MVAGSRGEAAAVLCACGAPDPARAESHRETEALLSASGKAVLVVQDLCGALARRDARLVAYAAGRPLVVFACRPRAVLWLFRGAGLAVPADVVDLRGDAAAVRAAVEARLAAIAAGAVESLGTDDVWVPWFPVVDEERCRRCGQCASFCVFGVYAARGDGGVSVTRPRSCKTGCPACARTCPSAAIVFPKHDEPPFDGSAITDEAAVNARTRRYTEEILAGDPYAALAERRRKAELLRRSGGGART